MRALFLGVSLGLAACSGLPPAPLVPLAAGEVTAGLTLDVPVHGDAPAGVSVWGGVGAGKGVDVAFSMDAPFGLVAELAAVGRGDRPFLPPGLAVRKTFTNGLGAGVGVASLRTALESVPPERGLVQFTAGPFVTLGPAGIEGPAVGRATVRAVYEVRVTRHDSTAEVRRGPAVYGAFSAGLVIRSDSAFVMPGGRALVGVRPGEPPGITVGPFVEGADTGRPLSAR